MTRGGEWNIVYYESANRDSPVYEFINDLEAKAKAKMINTLDLLEEYGTTLGSPHVRKLTGTGVWELRVLGKDSIRVLYVAVSGKTFLLLHGYTKTSQKTPKKEIKIALARLKEYRLRKS